MSDQERDNEQETSDRPQAGERLAIARRDQEISIRDIAKELHLDEVKVQALEENRFEALGAPVFAKGYLRKYAEIVAVPVDDILHDYYQLNRSAGAPPVVAEPRNVPRDIDLTRYILPAFILVVIAGAILWWLQAGSPLPSFDETDSTPASTIDIGQPTRETAAPVSTPSPVDAGDTGVEVPDGGAEAPAGDTADDPAVRVLSEPEPDAPAAASPALPQLRLTMTFTGDCWTEVTDAAGERLYFGLGQEGGSVDISGSAPLRVLFGNHENVSVAVDGAPYDIPRSALRGDTARFTINAP
jgi:cytoskeleton protein RodZ